MVKIQAFRGLEVQNFEIEPWARFQELKRLICKLFKIGKDVDVVINYYDTDGSGDWIRLSCEEDLEMAWRDLNRCTWYLQIIVAGDHYPWQTHHDITPQQRPLKVTVARTSDHWIRWDPPLKHDGIYSQPGGQLSDGPIGQSLWDNEPDSPRRQQHQSGGAVGISKMSTLIIHTVYRHFGSWKPKEEKRGNCIVKTYGPVGFEAYQTIEEMTVINHQ